MARAFRAWLLLPFPSRVMRSPHLSPLSHVVWILTFSTNIDDIASLGHFWQTSESSNKGRNTPSPQYVAFSSQTHPTKEYAQKYKPSFGLVVWGFEPLLVQGRWETTPTKTIELKKCCFRQATNWWEAELANGKPPLTPNCSNASSPALRASSTARARRRSGTVSLQQFRGF